MEISQITYNWFSHSNGEQYYDYTVGKESTVKFMTNDILKGKIVKSISLISLAPRIAEIIFEDGSKVEQANINSVAYLNKENDAK